jgi:tetratricopeptide (TPR) repeat protein
MSARPKSNHKWSFSARFRRHAFGRRSQPAIKRIKEAVSEIKKVARKDPALAAEGSVLFLERLSPAIEQVDSSSGAISTATDNAMRDLVQVIAKSPPDAELREPWLERLFTVMEGEDMDYLERLGDHWGELCATPEHASRWADRLLPIVQHIWSRPDGRFSYYKGAIACLDSLLAAGRHEDLVRLLAEEDTSFWHYHRYAVQSLVQQGRVEDALDLARELRTRNPNSAGAVESAIERILIDAGRSEEAYLQYGGRGSGTTYLARFRDIKRKYPDLEPSRILNDLVARAPENAGQWFAAAKSEGLLDEALVLAKQSPCAPQTLARAARDFAEEHPHFALGVGMQALYWIGEGYGYEVEDSDVLEAFEHIMRAARNLGREHETKEAIWQLMDDASLNARFLRGLLGHLVRHPKPLQGPKLPPTTQVPAAPDPARAATSPEEPAEAPAQEPEPRPAIHIDIDIEQELQGPAPEHPQQIEKQRHHRDLIRFATANRAGQELITPLQCRGRPHWQYCRAQVRVRRQELPPRIVFECHDCGRTGEFHHWQGSRWDLRDLAKESEEEALPIPIHPKEHRALLDLADEEERFLPLVYRCTSNEKAGLLLLLARPALLQLIELARESEHPGLAELRSRLQRGI